MSDFFANYFVPYWSQILVFFSVFGYLFSRFFSNKDKMSFKRYEIFQEKKLDATMALLNSYSVYMLSLSQLFTIPVMSYDVERDSIASARISILEAFNLCIKNFYVTKCYFKQKDFIAFDDYHILIDEFHDFITDFIEDPLLLEGITQEEEKSFRKKYESFRMENENKYVSLLNQVVDFYKS